MILFENITSPLLISGDVAILGRTAGYPLRVTEDDGRLALRIDAAILARRSRVARLGAWLVHRGGLWGWLSRWLYDDPAPGEPEGLLHFRNSSPVEVTNLNLYGGHASRAVLFVDHPA